MFRQASALFFLRLDSSWGRNMRDHKNRQLYLSCGEFLLSEKQCYDDGMKVYGIDEIRKLTSKSAGRGVQSKVAKDAEVTQSVLSNFSLKKGNMDLENFIRVLKVLGLGIVKIDDVVDKVQSDSVIDEKSLREKIDDAIQEATLRLCVDDSVRAVLGDVIKGRRDPSKIEHKNKNENIDGVRRDQSAVGM